VRLKDASDAKLTVDGKSLHTLTTLSAKKIYYAQRSYTVVYTICTHDLWSFVQDQSQKKSENLTDTKPKTSLKQLASITRTRDQQ